MEFNKEESSNKKNDFIEITDRNETSSTSVSSKSNDEKIEKRFFKNDRLQSFVDSFKRQVEPSHIGETNDLEVSPSNQIEGFGKTTELQQKIKPRHVFLIQMGTGIGTGLLVGNGAALAKAGPAGLFIGYVLVSSFIYCTYNAIAELGISYTQLSGSYNEFSSILVDRGIGFATAVIYSIQWLSVMPLELTTSTMIIEYWTTKVNPDVFVVIFYVLLVTVNFIGGSGYAEFEFVINTCKVLMIIGFIIFGIISDCGGSSGNGHTYIGGKYWEAPYGAFFGSTKIDHFKGICFSFVYATFSYGGFESSVLTAAEQINPRKSIVKAGKFLIYRIVVMYCVVVLICGLLVPHTSDLLMGNSSHGSSNASPLVIAAKNVKVIPHIINAVILMAVLSTGNNSLFSASRVILSICEQFFPNVPLLTYVDRRGRPVFCLIFAAIVGCISFVAASPKKSLVFTWLLSISGLSSLFTYFTMNLSHIRFRKAMKAQGRSLNEMCYLSKTGIWGSYYSVGLIILIFIAQFWIALVPVGSYKPNANNFFQNYLAMVVFLSLYFGFKIATREWQLFIPSEKVDLVRGRRIFDHELIEQEKFEEAEKLRNSSIYRKILEFWC